MRIVVLTWCKFARWLLRIRDTLRCEISKFIINTRLLLLQRLKHEPEKTAPEVCRHPVAATKRTKFLPMCEYQAIK